MHFYQLIDRFEILCCQNIPDALIDKVGGKVYTFGSFRLGISAKGMHCYISYFLCVSV